MGIYQRAMFWNATPEERVATYPCDSYLDVPFEGWVRAVDVAAPPVVLYRWLCQLKVAPYSYEFGGVIRRRNPKDLTPGIERLERGDRFLVFELVDFEENNHISGVVHPSMVPIYGHLATTYSAHPRPGGTSRLVVRLDVGATNGMSRIRRRLLAWGDLIMMRKQLLVLKALAERDVEKRPM